MFIILGGVALFIVVFYIGWKLDERDSDKLTASIEAKLYKLRDVYSFVEFASDSNKIYTTEFFVAKRFWDSIITSEEAAKEHLDWCYKRGYFKTDDGTTIPVCQIKSAKIITKLGV